MSSVAFLLAKHTFQRVCKEVCQDFGNATLSSCALDMLQSKAEQTLTTIFENSYKITTNANRTTLKLNDMQLAVELFNKHSRALEKRNVVQRNNEIRRPNNCRVFIAGFSAITSKRAVKKAFKRIGPTRRIHLVKVAQRPKAYGFVTFQNAEAAKRALQANIHLNNSLIRIQVALPKKSKKRKR